MPRPGTTFATVLLAAKGKDTKSGGIAAVCIGVFVIGVVLVSRWRGERPKPIAVGIALVVAVVFIVAGVIAAVTRP